VSASAPSAPFIVADVGGTHVRFALVDVSAAEPLIAGTTRRYRGADFTSFEGAMRRYLADVRATPAAAVIAAAGLRVNGETRLTNLPWVISQAAIEREFGFVRATLINDFAAMALSVPLLKPSDVSVIGTPMPALFDPRATQTFAVVGPGTGLGVGALLVREGHVHALETEGGHASLAPNSEEESRIIERLAARFGHVSNERAICGSGLVNLYEILCEMRGIEPTFSAPEQITGAADTDPQCRRALELLCEFLGALAGDLVLTFGAWNGVYVTGGVAPLLLPWIKAGRFRDRFENKGRLSAAVAHVPTSVVLQPDAGLLGAAAFAMREAGRLTARAS
jgi:glucokinase